MRVTKNIFGFCRAQAYLQRFKDLEQEVNRCEKEVVQKKEQLERLKKLTHLTHQDNFFKFLAIITQQQFQSEAVRKEKERLRQLADRLTQAKNDGDSQAAVAKRLAEEETLNREKMFITDLARFAVKFHRVAQLGKFSPQVKLGLELSSKNLEHKLQREGVEFLGKACQKYNKQIHEKVEGEGEEVKEVLERGIRARGMLVAKAKVHIKPPA